MPLNPTSLSSALSTILASLPVTAASAAAQFAQAYKDYASGGTFGTALPTITNANRDAMAATLRTAISVPAVGLPATFAGAWAAAVGVFWAAIPVGPVPAGATSGCPGASALTGSLTVVFANLANTPAACAAGMASALDTATKTVTAAVAPGPSPLTIA